MTRCAVRPFWEDKRSDDGGFSTVGVALALLVAISLVFTGAQVYRVQSAAADVQEAADACALAADNVIAEYYLVARVCDAVVLSLTLTGIVVLGMGVAALCTPLSAEAGFSLINAGKKVLLARDRFARKAADGLDKLQKALPFLAAVAAAHVAGANRDGMGAGYLGFAVVLPFEGNEVSAGEAGAADELVGTVDDAAGALAVAGEEAEKAAKRAKEAKERAYQADCGAYPGYCLYERAGSLADMPAGSNPFFSSVDTWGFSAALNRARAYYPCRLAADAPDGDSVEAQAESALRKRFYAFAARTLSREGFVDESGDSFSASFPLVPRNVDELRDTDLFSEAVYPVTSNDAGHLEMHAWEGCPRAAGAARVASLAERETGGYDLCPECQFTENSLGRVASASSSIDNGFEFHYRVIAEAASEYEEQKRVLEPKARKVRRLAGSLFEQARSALRKMAAQRISVAPPGRLGVVAIVAATDSNASDLGFSSRFVNGAGVLGPRVAISGATLVSDSAEQGRTIIASALDGVRHDGHLLAGVLDTVMDVWSSMLFAYADGQQRIGEGIDELDARLSFGGESRLGLWSSREFEKTMESLGLQPAQLDAPKPVLVNTGQVLQADGGDFSARLLSVKRVAANLSGNTALDGIVGIAERNARSTIRDFNGEITVATIEVAGDGSPTIPITITLPDSLRERGLGLVEGIAERLRGLAGDITGVRQWR